MRDLASGTVLVVIAFVCFHVGHGQHRFKNDPKFGHVLKRIHEGSPTPEDIAYLNTRIINGDHPHSPTMADVPDNGLLI